ncbi:MAG: prenyltransferase/squalene oxidase repeat-containing protein [Fimbriiglobus sp.]
MRTLLLLLGLGLLNISAASAQEEDAKKKKDIEATVSKGLEWLKKNQLPDGHWEANGGQYPTSMTALAGMAMLMEGSTLREGKYSDNLVKAVNWFMARSQPNGLLGNPNNATESARYTYGHGYGMLFLASVYGEEEDGDRRKKLEVILKKAVEFTGNAQTNRGGWGYLSAKEGGNFDEGSTTITQLQALRAAKNAGIPVKKEIINNATKYLKDSTTQRGGIIYSLANGGVANGQERPALTAAAIACAFSLGLYNDEMTLKWVKYCKDNIPIGRGRLSHDEYQSYYYAQVLYTLGENRYGEMFPKEAKGTWLTWSSYKDAMFEHLKAQQAADGSWQSGYIGAVYSTSVNLTILQLDKGILPIYHR